MKKFLINIWLILISLLSSASFSSEQNKILHIENPSLNFNVKIGDVLTRSVTYSLGANIKINPMDLPKKGKRIEDIELIQSDNQVISNSNDQKQYVLTLKYQVFKSASDITALALPAENIQFSDGSKLTVPAWKFWYSPLAKSTFRNAKAEMKGFSTVPLVETNVYKFILILCLSIMSLCILALIYLNLDLNWMPFVRGPFSIAYSKIKRIKDKGSHESIRMMLDEMHKAFDAIYGQSFFEKDITNFIYTQSKYAKAVPEITQFFQISNRALFGNRNALDPAETKKIMLISKSLRDCERGA